MKLSTIILGFVATAVCNPIIARQSGVDSLETVLGELSSDLPPLTTALANGQSGATAAAQAAVTSLANDLSTALAGVTFSELSPEDQATILALAQAAFSTSTDLAGTATDAAVTALLALPPNVGGALADVALDLSAVAGLVVPVAGIIAQI